MVRRAHTWKTVNPTLPTYIIGMGGVLGAQIAIHDVLLRMRPSRCHLTSQGETERLHKKVRDTREETLGGVDPKVAEDLSKLDGLFRDQVTTN